MLRTRRTRLSPAQQDRIAKEILHKSLNRPLAYYMAYYIISGSIGALTYPIYNSYNIYNTFKVNEYYLGKNYKGNYIFEKYDLPSNVKYNLYVDKNNYYNYEKGDTYGTFVSRNYKNITDDMLSGFITGNFFIIMLPYHMFMKTICYIVDKLEDK